MKKRKILVIAAIAASMAASLLTGQTLSGNPINKNILVVEKEDSNSLEQNSIESSVKSSVENIDNKNIEGNKEEDVKTVEVNPNGSEHFSQMKDADKNDIVTDTFQEDGEKIDETYVKDQVIFRAEKGVSFDEVKNIVHKDNGVVVGYIDNLGQYQVEYPNSSAEQLEERMDKLQEEKILRADTVGLNLVKEEETSIVNGPNDPWTGYNVSWDEDNPYGSEWGLESIKALSAWKYSGKMKKVNVGVLEVGKFFNSEDFNYKAAPYNNDGESEGYHANHVTGTIGAIINNGKGLAGTACNADLYGYGNTRTSTNFIKNVNKAITEDGVKVLNYSIGYNYKSYPSSSKTRSDIRYANNNYGSVLKDLLEGDYDDNKYDFVIAASAGNSRDDEIKIASSLINSSLTMIGAEGYEEYSDVKDRIIVVGAMQNLNDNKGVENYGLTDFTCLGKRVDIMAPGQNIYSNLHDNVYGYLSGTSMASPHVAGVASMIWGLDPSLTGKQVKDYIVKAADRNLSYTGNELSSDDFKGSYPILNALNSINEMVKDGRVQAVDGWNKIDGNWYYYVNGKKQTGWIHPDSWYYLDENGVMTTGWQKVNGVWYYLGTDGAMATGWKQVDGKWYYLESNGAMATGWKQVDGKWYYLENNGAMVTGWKQVDGKWYYLDSNGAMVTGWKQIDGKSYYFNSSGEWVENA